jgi:hypothetical protein
MKKGRQTWFLQPKKPRRLSPTQSRSSQVRQPLQDYIEFSLGFVVVLTLLEEEQSSRDTSQSREASRRLQQQVGQTEQPELEKTLAYLFEKPLSVDLMMKMLQNWEERFSLQYEEQQQQRPLRTPENGSTSMKNINISHAGHTCKSML